MSEKYLSPPPFISSAGPSPTEITLPRPSWVRLNCLHIGVGLFHSTMHKWVLGAFGKLQLQNSKANSQSITSPVASCPLHHLPKGPLGLAALEDDTADWLQRTALSN